MPDADAKPPHRHVPRHPGGPGARPQKPGRANHPIRSEVLFVDYMTKHLRVTSQKPSSKAFTPMLKKFAESLALSKKPQKTMQISIRNPNFVIRHWIQVEAEQAPVAANRERVRRFEAKIRTTIDRVWSAE